MAANARVQTRIDSGVKERAAAVLEQLGMTVSDAVRMLLTRTANEGTLPLVPAPVADVAAHDAWFRARVQEAVQASRPPVANEEMKARFARRRSGLGFRTYEPESLHDGSFSLRCLAGCRHSRPFGLRELLLSP